MGRGSRSENKLTRHQPVVVYYEEVDLSDDIWKRATDEAQLKRGEDWVFKATPILRERVNIVLAAHGKKLLTRATESRVRLALKTIKRLIEGTTASLPVPSNQLDRARSALLREVRRIRGHLDLELAKEIMAAVDNPVVFDERKDLRRLAMVAVKKLLEQSRELSKQGASPSIYLPLVQDLVWLFEHEGEGHVTGGKHGAASPFERWTVELAKCLPEHTRPSASEVRSAVRELRKEGPPPEPMYSRVSSREIPRHQTPDGQTHP
jgi:hypothetical protein